MKDKLELSQNAIKVLEKRYLKRDKDGNCMETPADMFRRVADSIADAELKYNKTKEETKVDLDYLMYALDEGLNSEEGCDCGCGCDCDDDCDCGCQDGEECKCGGNCHCHEEGE